MVEAVRSARRWWALGALVVTVLVIGLDGTIINVALPTLARDLGADSTELLWIGGGYLLTFSVAMLPVGRIGDRIGHKRVLTAGVGLFGAASLAGAFTGSAGGVIAVRAAMGLGAAMIMPISMALLSRIFPREEVPRAIAVWTAAAALGMPAGPVIGGWLLNHFWWGSVFLFNVPVVAVALLAGTLLLPGDGPRDRTRTAPFDGLGTALGTVGLTALVYGTILVPTDGWTDPSVLGALGAAAVLLALFLWRQRRAAEPLVDLALFADRRFSWGTLTAVFGNFTVTGILFVVPQYLETVQGYDAFGTGLRVLPLIGGLMVSAALSEGLVPRIGARAVAPAGLVALAVGVFLGAGAGPDSGYGSTALWLAVVGVGFGLVVVPSTSIVMASLPEARTGVGTSLLETLQQVGGVLGVAGLGSLLSAGYLARIDVDTLPGPAAATARDSVAGADAVAARLHDPALSASAHGAFVHGMSWVLTACGAVALLAAVLAALFLPGRTAAPAPDLDPTADETAPAAV
ncbi:EmrB/QacA subfamily drug resistance transporter [Kitasatospora sp. SolWspMP-SS2h]|uniref:MFS transporter n=1 Tax=Kitasatospora sp. SolWspMP-SS2h TaxID=1305729 RepID=UPI000DBA5003|nr:MFS transporter [Kitasatospora sp. SolWspMP-SS2h]RAJ33243.1 EmrB/QacA subfamily drug resistance transporter [Kitasatospora sp. SolWspMP-SS2h]